MVNNKTGPKPYKSALDSPTVIKALILIRNGCNTRQGLKNNGIGQSWDQGHKGGNGWKGRLENEKFKFVTIKKIRRKEMYSLNEDNIATYLIINLVKKLNKVNKRQKVTCFTDAKGKIHEVGPYLLNPLGLLREFREDVLEEFFKLFSFVNKSKRLESFHLNDFMRLFIKDMARKEPTMKYKSWVELYLACKFYLEMMDEDYEILNKIDKKIQEDSAKFIKENMEEVIPGAGVLKFKGGDREIGNNKVGEIKYFLA